MPLSCVSARDANENGIFEPEEYLATTLSDHTMLFGSYQSYRGHKRYEFSNHLGNLLLTISDKKTQNCNQSNTSWNVEVVSATDYSPFGAPLPLPGRSWNASAYRFGGAGGQQKDDEIFIGAYTAEFWEYDSRLGRRWNVDPITYPWQSSYAVFNNCPLVFIDPLGLSGEGTNDPPKDPKEGDKHTRTHTNGNKFEYEYKNGKWEETGGTGTFDEVIITSNKSNTPQKESNKNSFSLSNVLNRLKQFTSSTLNKIGSFLHEALKKGHREESNPKRKFEVKGGVVGYDEKASGVTNESKVSSNPYAYVDYGAILPTVGAAKDAGSGTGILQSEKWYKTVLNTISATKTTIGHAKDLDGGVEVEFDLKRNIHRSAPYTYDTIEYYKQGKLVGKTIHGEFKQEGN